MLSRHCFHGVLGVCLLIAAAVPVSAQSPDAPGRGTELSPEQQTAMRQAIGECRKQNEKPPAVRACVQQRLGGVLTPEQMQGYTRSRAQGYGGEGPSNLSEEQRAARRAAIEQCRAQNQQQGPEAVRACVQQKLNLPN
ncbi:hypothetical protein [Gloeobacter violaceus]|uniref:Gll1204 protein n=1 Tax=Gloeobacter violaceus (strain ATCC 29082 / PCC 7421) TaxID=251221 RepID=Q7NLC2_GLOVI|nr:hypothetical protein [Gloeobacter violaceus]BAC89145.1 gll1204 [Gloeobacter violaceus PCC 7421]